MRPEGGARFTERSNRWCGRVARNSMPAGPLGSQEQRVKSALAARARGQDPARAPAGSAEAGETLALYDSSIPSGFAGTGSCTGAFLVGMGELSGRTYMGFHNKDGQRDGFGVMRAKDGAIYSGQWSKGTREGHGALFFAGGVFEGQWFQGTAHGNGSVKFKNGDSFEGFYENNVKSGPGVYRWSDGAEELGEYADGRKTGWHRWVHGDVGWELIYEAGRMKGAKRLGEDVAEPLDADVAGQRPLMSSRTAADQLHGVRSRPMPRREAEAPWLAGEAPRPGCQAGEDEEDDIGEEDSRTYPRIES